MGKRSQPRKKVEIPVRIFGTDSDGHVFSEKVFTVNISRNGAELAGLRPEPGLDEIVGLTYGTNRVHFRVKWMGERGTPTAGFLGLLNIAPEKPMWDSLLPPDSVDDYQPTIAERRKNPRYRCPKLGRDSCSGGGFFLGDCSRPRPWRMLCRNTDPLRAGEEVESRDLVFHQLSSRASLGAFPTRRHRLCCSGNPV